jgi:branched-chain amino acid transport system permease protein
LKFIRKTSYEHDLRLFPEPEDRFWYGLLALALLAGPWLVSDYFLGQAVLVGVYVVAGVGLMLLAGYAGQISLGHAAFFAVGAYGTAVLEKTLPFALAFPAAGLIAGGVGVLVGLPSLRLSGIYLAIGTLASSFIVSEILSHWDSVTRGASGMTIGKIRFGEYVLDSDTKLYYLVLATAVASLWLARNVLRSPLGMAMMAVRDSQTAAQAVGVPLARVKLTAFALSAALTGLAGALYAHKIQFIDPDQFTILTSVELLVVVFIGGIGSLHGCVFGAVFIIVLPQAIAIAKDHIPAYLAEQTGLQSAVYAVLLLAFILFEPAGLYGIWQKTKRYFSMFPHYRKGSLRDQKSHARGESW